jgi:hypothetical protein
LLHKYELKKKILAHVNDEGSNLNVMTTIFFKFMICECLDLEERFQGSCVGHILPKTCWHLTTNEKVCLNLKYVYFNSIKFVEMYNLVKKVWKR